MALSQDGFPRSRHGNKDLSTMKEALAEKWGNEMQKKSQPIRRVFKVVTTEGK